MKLSTLQRNGQKNKSDSYKFNTIQEKSPGEVYHTKLINWDLYALRLMMKYNIWHGENQHTHILRVACYTLQTLISQSSI